MFMCKVDITDPNMLIAATNKYYFCKDYKEAYKTHKFLEAAVPKNGIKNSKPIVVFGCSFAYGIFLPDEDKVSARLADETGRIVYNRAMCAQGVQYLIYLLQDENFYKITPEPEYAVYIYINDQIRRLYMECNPWYKSSFYELDKNGNLSLIENPLYYTFPMVFVRARKYIKYDKDDISFMNKHFIYAKQLADKHWKNTKWIILSYNKLNDKKCYQEFSKLEKYGFKVVYAEEFVPDDFWTNLKYRISQNDYHPTKEAWQLLVPPFAKKYIK